MHDKLSGEFLQNKNRQWLCYGLIAWSSVFANSATAQEIGPTGLIAGTSFERRVVQDRSKRDIAYYVSRPKSGTAPIMLVIQGSGCTPVLTIRDGRASSSIYNLEKFARDGKFTVIAVEKPFSGFVVQTGSTENCSDAFNEDFTAESWRDALQAALNDARKASWVDHTRTLLLGSSEGAVMTSVVAANDPTITDVISISGSGTTQLFDFIAQAYGDCFNASVCLADIEKNVSAIKADPQSHTKFAWGHPYKRWTSFFNIDPGELLLKSKARVYVAIGTADEVVPAISQELAATKLLLAGRDVTVRRVADGTHSLNRRNAGNRDELDRELRIALAWFSRGPTH
jgi:predicted esterase